MSKKLFFITVLYLSFAVMAQQTPSAANAVLGDALLNEVMNQMEAMRADMVSLQAEVNHLQSELEARNDIKVHYHGVKPYGYNPEDGSLRGGNSWGQILEIEDDPRSAIYFKNTSIDPFSIDVDIRRPCTLLMIANGHIRYIEGDEAAWMTFTVEGVDAGKEVKATNVLHDNTFTFVNGSVYDSRPTKTGDVPYFNSIEKFGVWVPVNFVQSHQITSDDLAKYGNNVTVDLRIRGSGLPNHPVTDKYSLNGLGMQVVSMGCE